jgi:thioredoxin reductase (NADPH)
VVVIGGGDTAVSSALYLSNLVSQVTMLVRKPQCKCTNQVVLNNLLAKDNVEIMFNSTLERIDKDALGNAILHVGKSNHYVDTMLLGVSAIFACIGSDPNVVDHAGEGRIWKCGDCIEESKQVAVAVGSGAGVALRMIAE